MLTIALPKGSLEEQTMLLFSQADLEVKKSSREYNPTISDPRIGKVKILRPQEIPVFVQDGDFDLGISGHDWVTETGADVVEVADMPYAKTGTGVVSMVLAVPDDSTVAVGARHRAGQPHHHRVPQRHAALLRGARHSGRGVLQLRRDRGQGARDDGRAGRPHRDRLDAAPQRPQDRRHGARRRPRACSRTRTRGPIRSSAARSRRSARCCSASSRHAAACCSR